MDLYQQIRRNKRHSVILMTLALLPVVAFLFSIIWLLTRWYSHVGNVWLALGVSLTVGIALAVYVYRQSYWLLIRSCWAAPAFGPEAEELGNIVEELAIGAGIPAPSVFVAEDRSPNAFSVGVNPNNALIVVNRGLIEKMSREEVSAVLAHEMSHIRSYDTLVGTLLAGFLTTMSLKNNPFLRRSACPDPFIGYEATGYLLGGFASAGARLAQVAYSRDREYAADASAAILTHNPGALASALEKIENDSAPPFIVNKALSSLYIVNPLSTFIFDHPLVDSHPPLKERIRVLKAMTGGAEGQPEAA